jgi:hypothetical protein
MIHPDIEDRVAADRNIHSWHRWVHYSSYYETMGRTKILIYPGVFDFPQWDSKRQWEAHASGCLVMYEQPTVDMSSYPVTELVPFAVYNDYDEMVDKCNWLLANPEELEAMRLMQMWTATRFSSEALARRLLWYVKEAM